MKISFNKYVKTLQYNKQIHFDFPGSQDPKTSICAKFGEFVIWCTAPGNTNTLNIPIKFYAV